MLSQFNNGHQALFSPLDAKEADIEAQVLNGRLVVIATATQICVLGPVGLGDAANNRTDEADAGRVIG